MHWLHISWARVEAGDHLQVMRRKVGSAERAAKDGNSCGCLEAAFFKHLEHEVVTINKCVSDAAKHRSRVSLAIHVLDLRVIVGRHTCSGLTEDIE